MTGYGNGHHIQFNGKCVLCIQERRDKELAARKVPSRGKKFWMICQDPMTVYSSNPKQTFESRAKAREAAERLCRETGKRFYLLESVDYVDIAVPPVKWAGPDATG